jgi:hypothetical protein
MRVQNCGPKPAAMLGALCLALGLLWSSAVRAETRVYLLRGWFGVFSTGLDNIADDLSVCLEKVERSGSL